MLLTNERLLRALSNEIITFEENLHAECMGIFRLLYFFLWENKLSGLP